MAAGRNLKRTLFLAAMAALCAPCALYSAIKARCFPLAWTEPGASEIRKIESSPKGSFAIFKYIRRELPEGSLLLSFRPGDSLYYSGRKVLCEGDPRLAKFYRAADKAEAWEELRRLGVGYLCLPSYEPPTVANSCVKPLVEDPSLSEIAFETDCNRLYKLRGSPDLETLWLTRVNGAFSGSNESWLDVAEFNLPLKTLSGGTGGRRVLFSAGLEGCGYASVILRGLPSKATATVWAGRLDGGRKTLSAQAPIPAGDADFEISLILAPKSRCEIFDTSVSAFGSSCAASEGSPPISGEDALSCLVRAVKRYDYVFKRLM